MATLLPFISQTFYDSNGLPLAGGKLYSYQAGTTTPLATYTDATESNQATNPIILDGNGQAQVWIGAGPYKFVLKDSSNVTQWTVDNVAVIGASAVTTTRIADANVTTAKLADGSVTTAKIADGNVTTAKILDANITTTKIADSNVTTQKIADANVTTDKIADANVTTAKIADLNVTNAKIADGAVTRAKMASVGQQVSATCASFSTGSTSYVDITNLSVTITTTGRPVMILLMGDGVGQPLLQNTAGGAALFKIIRGASLVQEWSLSGSYMPSVISAFDVQVAGTYTYKVQAHGTSLGGAVTVTASNMKLVAYEL